MYKGVIYLDFGVLQEAGAVQFWLVPTWPLSTAPFLRGRWELPFCRGLYRRKEPPGMSSLIFLEKQLHALLLQDPEVLGTGMQPWQEQQLEKNMKSSTTFLFSFK